MNSLYVTLFLNELLEFICLHTVKWFQVLLFNICNSIYQIFLSNTNKWNTAIWFQITYYKWFSCSIWPLDGGLTGTTTPVQSGLESNANEGVLHIPQTPRLEPHHQIQFSVIPRILKFLFFSKQLTLSHHLLAPLKLKGLDRCLPKE